MGGKPGSRRQTELTFTGRISYTNGSLDGVSVGSLIQGSFVGDDPQKDQPIPRFPNTVYITIDGVLSFDILSVKVAAVPEPTSAWLVLAGGLAVAAIGRRRARPLLAAAH